MGKGNKKLKANPLEKEDIMLMYERNVLGQGKNDMFYSLQKKLVCFVNLISCFSYRDRLWSL